MWTRLVHVGLPLAGPAPADATVHAGGQVLATLADLRLVVEDRVTGGCLLDAAGIRGAVEGSLLAGGLPTDDGSVMTMRLLFSGFDVEPGEDRLPCVVTVDLNLFSHYPGFGLVVLASDARILSGPGHLDDGALGAAQAFAGEVVAAVRHARATAGPRP